MRLFKKEGGILRASRTCLKLEDVKTPEKVGGEGHLIPSKMKLKSKLNSLIINRRWYKCQYL
jgi:hypothetical protein